MQMEVSRRLGPVMVSRIERGFEAHGVGEGESVEEADDGELETDGGLGGAGDDADGASGESDGEGGEDGSSLRQSEVARVLARMASRGDEASEEAAEETWRLLDDERVVRRLMQPEGLGDEAAVRWRRDEEGGDDSDVSYDESDDDEWSGSDCSDGDGGGGSGGGVSSGGGSSGGGGSYGGRKKKTRTGSKHTNGGVRERRRAKAVAMELASS